MSCFDQDAWRVARRQTEREGIIARNVAALSAPPRVRAKEGRTLTVEQARRLLDAAADHRFELVIILALAYGMRRGEVLGLRWSALNWEAGTLQVTHSVQRIKSREGQLGHRTQLIVGELKTPRSRRSLALTPEILAKLRQQHTQQAEHRMAAGPAWREHGLIFASETGAPLDPENFSRAFAKLCNRAGLGHWHPHELRHSGASRCSPRAHRCTWCRRSWSTQASQSPRTSTGTWSKETGGPSRGRPARRSRVLEHCPGPVPVRAWAAGVQQPARQGCRRSPAPAQHGCETQTSG
jgi:integrase